MNDFIKIWLCSIDKSTKQRFCSETNGGIKSSPRIKCLVWGLNCHSTQIWTGDFTVESPGSYPLRHVSSTYLMTVKGPNSFWCVHGIMSLARGSIHGIMSLTCFPAHGIMSLSQCALHCLYDIMPCTGKRVTDIMPWTLPRNNDIMPCAQQFSVHGLN